MLGGLIIEFDSCHDHETFSDHFEEVERRKEYSLAGFKFVYGDDALYGARDVSILFDPFLEDRWQRFVMLHTMMKNRMPEMKFSASTRSEVGWSKRIPPVYLNPDIGDIPYPNDSVSIDDFSILLDMGLV